MTFKRFVKKHRNRIDDLIREHCGDSTPIDNEERRLWVLNDEGLYRLALRQGLKKELEL